MTDVQRTLVQRLRTPLTCGGIADYYRWMKEAADEIERQAAQIVDLNKDANESKREVGRLTRECDDETAFHHITATELRGCHDERCRLTRELEARAEKLDCTLAREIELRAALAQPMLMNVVAERDRLTSALRAAQHKPVMTMAGRQPCKCPRCTAIREALRGEAEK
jgi:predicted RNase H-like nuclease (RuvC/YqgF family)